MVIFNAALAVIAIISFLLSMKYTEVDDEHDIVEISTEDHPIEVWVFSGSVTLLLLSSIITVFV